MAYFDEQELKMFESSVMDDDDEVESDEDDEFDDDDDDEDDEDIDDEDM